MNMMIVQVNHDPWLQIACKCSMLHPNFDWFSVYNKRNMCLKHLHIWILGTFLAKLWYNSPIYRVPVGSLVLVDPYKLQKVRNLMRFDMTLFTPFSSTHKKKNKCSYNKHHWTMMTVWTCRCFVILGSSPIKKRYEYQSQCSQINGFATARCSSKTTCGSGGFCSQGFQPKSNLRPVNFTCTLWLCEPMGLGFNKKNHLETGNFWNLADVYIIIQTPEK